MAESVRSECRHGEPMGRGCEARRFARGFFGARKAPRCPLEATWLVDLRQGRRRMAQVALCDGHHEAVVGCVEAVREFDRAYPGADGIQLTGLGRSGRVHRVH